MIFVSAGIEFNDQSIVLHYLTGVDGVSIDTSTYSIINLLYFVNTISYLLRKTMTRLNNQNTSAQVELFLSNLHSSDMLWGRELLTSLYSQSVMCPKRSAKTTLIVISRN